RIGLHYSLFEEEATDTSRETLGLTAAVDFDRPDGSFTLGFAADDTPDGTRLSVDFGRTYTLPTGSLSASIGLTRGTDAELYATGNLQMRYTLPRGALTASLNRSVGPGSDDAEEIVTSLSLGAHNALTPVSNIGVNLAFVRAEEAAETTDITSFGVTYDYALGPDWSLSAGYGFQQRDDAGGSANASSVSLTLSRTFDFRP
ncbi:MAG: porin, partial [Rhodobacteraceae bacterium]|nr:porin [Paracoccaceae bacterium]